MLLLRPRVLRDLVIDTFSQFAVVELKIPLLQRRVAGKYKNRLAHKSSPHRPEALNWRSGT